MYSAGSVVGKASLIDPEMSPTPPLIFTGGQKVLNLASFSTSLLFELPSFQNEATYRYQSFGLGASMIELCSLQVWSSMVHPL